MLRLDSRVTYKVTLKIQMVSALLFVNANPGGVEKTPVFPPLGAFTRHVFRKIF